jgi:hypothetical protein
MRKAIEWGHFPSVAVGLLLHVSACAPGDAEPVTASLPVASVEREIRIGAVDNPEYSFGAVGALEVGADGRIYTLHRQEATVRVWTPAGLAADSIGRRGEGPGEFISARTIGWKGDSLWVFDSTRNARITFFDADGRYLGQVMPQTDLGSVELAVQGIYPPRPEGVLGDGSLLGITPGFSQDIVEGKITSIAHTRMDREGAVLDTIVMIPVGREAVLGVLRDGGGTFSAQPFGDPTLNVLTADATAYILLDRRAAGSGEIAEFRVHRVALSGDTVFSRAYPYLPTPITPDTVEHVIRERAESLHGFVGERTGTTLPQWVEWVSEATYRPAYFTPVSAVVAGRDDTIWLALHPPAGTDVEWLVLDPEGEPLRTLTLPASLRVFQAEESYVWGVERDEFDVEYIVRYRVLL